MSKLTTGNRTVDAMATINITGNVIPQMWYKTILRVNGRPYLLAIIILADIVYWYRPKEIRDEATGYVIGWEKRFSGDLLQRSYAQLANIFGESKRSVIAALDCLEGLGVVKRRFMKKVIAGTLFNNILYLELNHKKLHELTYPESDYEHPDNEQIDNSNINKSYSEDNSDNAMQNNECPPTKECNRVIQSIVGSATKNDVEGLQKKSTPVTSVSSTNTKNYNNHINQSYVADIDDGTDMINKCTDLVKRNIDYEYLEGKYALGDIEEIDEMVGLIVDIIGVKRCRIRVAGADYPSEIVKERFMKITSEHVEYVLNSMHMNTSTISNIKAYLLTALFNSVNTINNYYKAKVNSETHNIDSTPN